jgi:hypothetical protein
MATAKKTVSLSAAVNYTEHWAMNMMVRSTNGIRLMLTAALIFMASGCGGVPAVIHYSVLSKAPYLADGLEQAPPTQSGCARVVFFCPRLPALDIALLGGLAFVDVGLENPRSLLRVELMDQTGLYADVPADTYDIQVNSAKSINATFEEGKTYYLRIACGVFTDQKTQILDDPQAAQELREKKIRWFDGKFLQDETAAKFAVVPKKEGKWLSVAPTSSGPNGRIYFFNTKSPIIGPLMQLKSGVDCLPTYPVDSKKYVCFEVTPGRHVFSAHATNLGQDVIAPVGKEAVVQEGQDMYFSFGLSEGVKVMSPNEAQKLLKEYGLTKNGYYTPGN